VRLICGDSGKLSGREPFDGVFTDPPYFGNVQYAELIDFCYVWLRRLAGAGHAEFDRPSTRNPRELTGNISMGRDLAHFTDGISMAFRKSAERLKPGAAFTFTYHHNRLDAYVPLAVAMLDMGMACSASLPCPAEMGASIHINGTNSSVIDTVFVCRQTGRVPRKWIVTRPEELAALVRSEIHELADGGLKVTQGDIRCMVFGHLTRLAVWNLRHGWKGHLPIWSRMQAVQDWYVRFGGCEAVLAALETQFSSAPARQDWMLAPMLRESAPVYDEIPF
jgi:adenine-specific DNA methylase